MLTMIEPYTYDWTLRVEGRHHFLSSKGRAAESIPLEIDDLFTVDELRPCQSPAPCKSARSTRSLESFTVEPTGTVVVSDLRSEPSDRCPRGHVMGGAGGRPMTSPDFSSLESCTRLNQVVLSRSQEADLVVLNLPQQWGTEGPQAAAFVNYCNALTAGLKRVVFVHSSGHEVFDLSN